MQLHRTACAVAHVEAADADVGNAVVTDTVEAEVAHGEAAHFVERGRHAADCNDAHPNCRCGRTFQNHRFARLSRKGYPLSRRARPDELQHCPSLATVTILRFVIYAAAHMDHVAWGHELRCGAQGTKRRRFRHRGGGAGVAAGTTERLLVDPEVSRRTIDRQRDEKSECTP